MLKNCLSLFFILAISATLFQTAWAIGPEERLKAYCKTILEQKVPATFFESNRLPRLNEKNTQFNIIQSSVTKIEADENEYYEYRYLFSTYSLYSSNLYNFHHIKFNIGNLRNCSHLPPSFEDFPHSDLLYALIKSSVSTQNVMNIAISLPSLLANEGKYFQIAAVANTDPLKAASLIIDFVWSSNLHEELRKGLIQNHCLPSQVNSPIQPVPAAAYVPPHTPAPAAATQSIEVLLAARPNETDEKSLRDYYYNHTSKIHLALLSGEPSLLSQLIDDMPLFLRPHGMMKKINIKAQLKNYPNMAPQTFFDLIHTDNFWSDFIGSLRKFGKLDVMGLRDEAPSTHRKNKRPAETEPEEDEKVQLTVVFGEGKNEIQSSVTLTTDPKEFFKEFVLVYSTTALDLDAMRELVISENIEGEFNSGFNIYGVKKDTLDELTLKKFNPSIKFFQFAVEKNNPEEIHIRN